jgi:hypothetical protein
LGKGKRAVVATFECLRVSLISCSGASRVSPWVT